MTCPQMPCFCPETGCSFIGSTGMLLEHFIADHHWPSTNVKYGWCFNTDVQEGIHVLSGEDGHLFLLNVMAEPFGCVVSVFCVQPHDTEPKFRCAMSFSYWKNDLFNSQSSEFEVPSTTLTDGIPRNCILFIVPKFYLEKDSKICVTMKQSLKNLMPSVPTGGTTNLFGIPS
uniref:SIAH-type domain-containing protein n=1 Tax=Arundo donax TaxID=35708 RepID=A0A0A9H6B2_ARUDO